LNPNYLFIKILWNQQVETDTNETNRKPVNIIRVNKKGTCVNRSWISWDKCD